MSAHLIHTCEPAHSIIEKLGGRTYVAEQLELDRSTISRWCQPYPAGTDGSIPRRHWKKLLDLAKKIGVGIDVQTIAGLKS